MLVFSTHRTNKGLKYIPLHNEKNVKFRCATVDSSELYVYEYNVCVRINAFLRVNVRICMHMYAQVRMHVISR